MMRPMKKLSLVTLGLGLVMGSFLLTFTDMSSPIWKFTVTAAVIVIGLFFWLSGNRQD